MIETDGIIGRKLQRHSNRQELAMTLQTLENRVKVLESQFAKLQDTIAAAQNGPEKNWERAVEKYAGDEGLMSIFREAKKLREADRKRAREKNRPRGKRK